MEQHVALLGWIIELTADTETIIHFGCSTIVTKSRAGCCGAAALCAFASFLLSFPSISGRCSLLPSVMGILSKMLFNFRKAADGLCEASSSENPQFTLV